MANSVFANAFALDAEHVPETLQHRDGEFDELRDLYPTALNKSEILR